MSGLPLFIALGYAGEMTPNLSKVQGESGAVWVEAVPDGSRNLVLLVAVSSNDVQNAPDRVCVYLTSRQTAELIKQLSIACRG